MTLQDDANASAQQNRSHAEIQALLRDEVKALSGLLDERLQEIETLTGLLDGRTVLPVDQAEEIEAMKRRHRIEILLLHRFYAMARHGPAEGVPKVEALIKALRKSDAFDARWYVETYPDVAESGIAPEHHYATAGAFESRDPGPDFSTMDYYLANPDVAEGGWPALCHYAMHGRAEKRPLRP